MNGDDNAKLYCARSKVLEVIEIEDEEDSNSSSSKGIEETKSTNYHPKRVLDGHQDGNDKGKELDSLVLALCTILREVLMVIYLYACG